MANFLFASVPLVGHVNPGVPIARELIRRGHQVAWYTGKSFEGTVQAIGAHFLPRRAASDYDVLDVNTVFPGRARLRGLASLKFDIKHLFLDSIAGHRADLAAVLPEIRPDVLVSDSLFFGVETLRDELPCAWASYGVSCLGYHSVDTPPFGLGLKPIAGGLNRFRNRLSNFIAEEIVGRDVMSHYNRIRSDLGLERSGQYLANVIVDMADLYLQPTIPSFEYPRTDLPRTVHFVGALLPQLSRPFVPPPWWAELQAGQPVVHVTQGTLATNGSDLLFPTLRALAKEKVLVVATTGGKRADSDRLPALPDNARLESFVPHNELLPFVDVMVTNGGFGGVQCALANGVPLVVAGKTEEKTEVCARVQWSGAGINLKTNTPHPREIRKAVRKVLEIPRFKEKARRLQMEYRSYDAPRASVDLLETLARTQAPVLRS
jgi:UDP:flavonoid glycosyltransferase YjiC (YdhE family)